MSRQRDERPHLALRASRSAASSALATASAGSAARCRGSPGSPSRSSDQVPSPTTGFPIFSARAISDSVPNSPADGDHGVGGAGHDRVARLAETRRDADREVRRAVGAIVVREDAHRGAARGSTAPGRRVHDSAEASAHEHGAGLGEQASDLLGGGRLVGGRLPRADHRDVGALAHGRSMSVPRRDPRPAAQPHVMPRIAAKSEAAAGLSSGSLPFPHFGLCTHDGHPSEQGHCRIVSRVAARSRSM